MHAEGWSWSGGRVARQSMRSTRETLDSFGIHGATSMKPLSVMSVRSAS